MCLLFDVLSVIIVCGSNEKRERGNTLYARAQFSRAVDVYTMYVFRCLLHVFTRAGND